MDPIELKKTELINKVWSGEIPLKKLKENPVKVIQDELNCIIHPGVKIEVHVETDKLFHLVIPAKPPVVNNDDIKWGTGKPKDPILK
jgi:hypothetical protein